MTFWQKTKRRLQYSRVTVYDVLILGFCIWAIAQKCSR
jgi:hypothetical protein